MCLAHVVHELHEAQTRQGWQHKTKLTLEELVHVAIAYNRGKSNLSKGFKQGHFNGTRCYGENIHEFLILSQTIEVVAAGTSAAPSPVPASGVAVLPAPAAPTATGQLYRANVTSTLNLRRGPGKTHEVVKKLSAGQLVRRIDGTAKAEWFEVEAIINDARFTGFVSSEWLKKVTPPAAVPVPTPALAQPAATTDDAPPAVLAPRQPGTITRRKDPAGARSLNEDGQPSREGDTAEERVASIHKIMDWLDVANNNHKRYKPGNGKTFCNIYAHDFCHLAGVYLPRVWWRGPALVKLARGEMVQPLLGSTIDEQRANDLCRWLNDFGTAFGWRETASLTELQNAANLGAVCLIIARRKVEGASGHVVMIVPETDTEKASRNSGGEVTNPVQSQAGSVNFKRRRGTLEWYKHARFEEHGFWIHA